MTNCYDYSFISNVYDLLTSYHDKIEHEYTEEAREWYHDLLTASRYYLGNMQRRRIGEYENTPEGETLSSWIFQYHAGGEEFENELTNHLIDLMRQRDSIIHNPRNHHIPPHLPYNNHFHYQAYHNHPHLF